MKATKISFIVLCIVLLSVYVANKFYVPRTHKYRIGAIYPLTGMAASMGKEFERGVQIAIAKAQAQGVDVEVLFEDSKTEAKTAVAAYHALRTKGVDAILTTVTGCASAIIPMARMDKIILFADVAKPRITDEYENLFRHSSTAEQEAEIIIDFLKEKHSNASVILWMQDEYCIAVKDKLLENADSMRIDDFAFDKEQDIDTIISRALINAKVDSLIVVGFGSPLGNIIKGARQLGFQGDIVVNMGLSVTTDAQNAAGEAVHGVYYTSMHFDQNDEEYQKYCEEYLGRYGMNPSDYSLLAYNSAVLLTKVAENRLYDATGAKSFLINLKSVKSVGEVMTITCDRDILPPVILLRRQ